MAKKIKTKVKLQLPGGAATPAPPVGSALGQHGASGMDFCKRFNAETANRRGETVPVEITIFVDKSFTFITKLAPVSELLKKVAKIKKGSQKPGTSVAGQVTWKAVEEIATLKMEELNAWNVEAAKKVVAGSARSMGLEVVD
ncbi:50S ribosomal protein L11 [bacterium]|jgi:large subunit ribosomal protein L11|nr:50S ribosomal protein L11 [bacterium]